ncbi:hypothetical protein P0Y35_04790 [Kiritimatiellaeota bacterium B1221]|nr:hypothetical protein [Kiritimatiellaeota bacterium B1221]
MKLKIILMCFISFSALWAAPSSIDSLGLPEVPENRYQLDEWEKIDREAEIWYTFYTYYKSGEDEVKHGLWIERTRSRDRERHATDFEETRKIYYEGEVSVHSVVSIWINGVLRQRDYILSEDLRVTVKFNEQGQEMRGPKANARGGRAKKERIIRVFNDVYNLTN